ncbi:hypothetical protein ACFYYM_07705 [Streptomyces erythrochromogenes]
MGQAAPAESPKFEDPGSPVIDEEPGEPAGLPEQPPERPPAGE